MEWTGINRRIVRCDLCPRLRDHCRQIATVKRRAYRDWKYWGKPVPNFGDPDARFLIVGLAPAAHGANRTGRMFTGDRSGDWLFRALHQAGFATQAESTRRRDGLELNQCAITAVCHCAPPDNKPSREEIGNCRSWLTRTIDLLDPLVLLALGQIAWQGLLPELLDREWIGPGKRPKFAHGTQVMLAEGRWLLGCYHPSQQNTFTGRLTEEMLGRVLADVRGLLESAE